MSRVHPLWRARYRPLLEALEERVLLSGGLNPYLVSNTNDSGDGSLRQAILNADSNGGANVISFNIPRESGSVQTIFLQTALPALTAPATIDGASQAGYTNHPLIVLDGSQIPTGSAADGLTISASNATVRAIAIDHFRGNGVVVNDPALDSGSDTTAVVSNITLETLFIGVDAFGSEAAANAGDGILLRPGVQDAQVGSTTAGNLIANNGGAGVRVLGRDPFDNALTDPNLRAASAKRNNIEGNYIGVALADGSSIFDEEPSLTAAGNGGDGIFLDFHTSANYVADNVIGGNGGDGINLRLTAFNLIDGNLIGTDAHGDALGNAQDGILIQSGVDNGETIGSILNRIGDEKPGDISTATNTITDNGGNGVHLTGSGTSNNVVGGNLIGAVVNGTGEGDGSSNLVGNKGDGVLIDGGASGNLIGVGPSTAGNEIGINPPIISTANTIEGNQGNGVEIAAGSGAAVLGNSISGNANLGIDQTPPTGPDTNPVNGATNYPVLTAATLDAADPSATVSGTLNSTADANVHLEFFYNATADPSGYGQGTTYLGSLDVQTNSNGDLSFTTDLSLPAATGYLTATATVNGNTSEFSKDFAIGDVATFQVSGGGQSAFVNTLFAAPLIAHAEVDGQPLAGAVVVFTAPSSSNPGGFFQTGSGATTVEAVTDADGNASFTFLANSFAGNETVTASLQGAESSPGSFALTNKPVLLEIGGIPDPQGAGVPGSFTVTVVDAAHPNNLVTNYQGSVNFTSSDGNATITPTQYTFSPSDGGTKTFPATLRTLGSQSLTVTDATNPNLTATQDFTVVPGPAVQLDVTAGSTTVTAGDTATFTVITRDQFGNVATGYSGTVTLTLSAGVVPFFRVLGYPPGPTPQMVTLSHTFAAADAGQFSFQVLLTVAGPYIVTAGDGTLSNNTNVTVQPGSVVGLQLVNLPTTVTAGQPVTFTVAARDAFGNLVPSYNPTVTFSSNDPNAVLPGPTPLAGGWGRFTATLNLAGSDTITVTDGNGLNTSQTVNVPDTLTGTSELLLPSTGATFTAIVAHFDDTAATDLSRYTALIDWGDGVIDNNNNNVQIVAAAGGFDVLGTHQYAVDGAFTIHVSLANNLRGTSATVDSSAVVLSAAELAALANYNFVSIPPASGDINTPLATPGVSAVLDQPTGNTKTSSLFLGAYKYNPEPGSDLPGVFFEVKTSHVAADATLTLTFDYATLGTTNVQVMYFNVADNQYEAVPPSDFVNDPDHHTLTLTLGATTTPTLQQVVHTVFTITLPPLPPPPGTPAPQTAQVTQVTPTLAAANTAPSVLGQTLTRASDVTNSYSVPFEANYQTTGPTLTLAPSADRATSIGTTALSGGGDDQRSDLDRLTAAAESAALRGLSGVDYGILNGVPADDPGTTPPKKNDKELPESEETAPDALFEDDMEELPVRLWPGVVMDSTASPVAMPLVMKAASSDVWAAAGLLVGVTSSRWAKRDDEEEDAERET